MNKELEFLKRIDTKNYLTEREHRDFYLVVEKALLNAEKYEKIILGIEDYLNRRIKVEPLGDVRKAFIEIRNQLQVIKEVLEWADLLNMIKSKNNI